MASNSMLSSMTGLLQCMDTPIEKAFLLFFFCFPSLVVGGGGSTLKRRRLERILSLRSWPYLGRAMPSRKPTESHRKVSLTKIKKI